MDSSFFDRPNGDFDNIPKSLAYLSSNKSLPTSCLPSSPSVGPSAKSKSRATPAVETSETHPSTRRSTPTSATRRKISCGPRGSKTARGFSELKALNHVLSKDSIGGRADVSVEVRASSVSEKGTLWRRRRRGME